MSMRISRVPTRQMPVLFIGHGSPMNAIEDNPFSREWRALGEALPKPKAILCISAHWETWGTLVTAMDQPRTIHDFSGFPKALYEKQYPAPGCPWLIERVLQIVRGAQVGLDLEWGLDHGCWSVLCQMFPNADIPVVQLSMDYTFRPQDHYFLAKELAPLRNEGVLIIGSGNMVHNLRRMTIRGNDFRNINEPYGFDWADEANALFKQLIQERDHQKMIGYPNLGLAVNLAVPTPEHYMPLLYAVALQQKDESVIYFNDQLLAGSVSMTSLIIQREET